MSRSSRVNITFRSSNLSMFDGGFTLLCYERNVSSILHFVSSFQFQKRFRASSPSLVVIAIRIRVAIRPEMHLLSTAMEREGRSG